MSYKDSFLFHGTWGLAASCPEMIQRKSASVISLQWRGITRSFATLLLISFNEAVVL